MRQFQQHFMIKNANHDGIDVARQDASGVGDGFTATELHFLPGQCNRVSAELTDCDVEGHPRACRRLVEDHGQHFAGERATRGDVWAVLLHGTARVDHAAQFAGRDVDEIQEMANLAVHPVAPDTFGLLLSDRSIALAARSRRSIPSEISLSLMTSGGSNRTTLSPAATASTCSAR